MIITAFVIMCLLIGYALVALATALALVDDERDDSGDAALLLGLWWPASIPLVTARWVVRRIQRRRRHVQLEFPFAKVTKPVFK